MDEERSLSIPSSESDDNVRLRGRIQRRFKRSNHSERLLTEPTNNDTKGTRVICHILCTLKVEPVTSYHQGVYETDGQLRQCQEAFLLHPI